MTFEPEKTKLTISQGRRARIYEFFFTHKDEIFEIIELKNDDDENSGKCAYKGDFSDAYFAKKFDCSKSTIEEIRKSAFGRIKEGTYRIREGNSEVLESLVRDVKSLNERMKVIEDLFKPSNK